MHIIDSLSSLQQQKSLMFNPNALIGLAQKGMPRVVEVSLDSRREIDFQIKKVCEEFINNCVDGAVEPLTAFLVKVDYCGKFIDKLLTCCNIVISYSTICSAT